MLKWTAAIITLIFTILVAGVILTITGVIHPQDTLIRLGESIPSLTPYIETYYIGRDSQQWHSEQQAAIDDAWVQIELSRDNLVQQELRLQQLSEDLDRRETALIEQQNRNLNIAHLADLYSHMHPEEAADILKLLDEELILAVVLAMDNETAAIILPLLPSDLAAELSSRFN